MKVIVTCGPSYEPVDEVRRITNFSTGELGVQRFDGVPDRPLFVARRNHHAQPPERPVDGQNSRHGGVQSG